MVFIFAMSDVHFKEAQRSVFFPGRPERATEIVDLLGPTETKGCLKVLFWRKYKHLRSFCLNKLLRIASYENQCALT